MESGPAEWRETPSAGRVLCYWRVRRKQGVGCPGGVMPAEYVSSNWGSSAQMLKLAAGTRLGRADALGGFSVGPRGARVTQPQLLRLGF